MLPAAQLLRLATRPGGLGIVGLTGADLLAPPMLHLPIRRLELGGEEVEAEEETAELEPTVFGTEIRADILHRSIRWHRNNWRQGTAKTKHRGEVHGSTRKVRPQKGQGRSRAGDSRMPHWKGGGVVHGPRPKDWSHDLPLTVRQQALRVALSARFADSRMFGLSDLQLQSAKTKDFVSLLHETKWMDLPVPEAVPGMAKLPDRPARLLFVGDEHELADATNFSRASANLQFVKLIARKDLHPYNILYHDRLFLTKRVIQQLNVMYKRKH